MKKTFVWIGIALILLAAIVWVAVPTKGNSALKGKIATEYKSMGCGCCGTYGQYLIGKGMHVEMVNSDDPSTIKDEYAVPEGLRSCHTTVMDGYFVEGHVPTEAIERMMIEKPDIKGIAISGMPSGSPGMPGGKEEPFIVYAVNNDGTYKEYMRI